MITEDFRVRYVDKQVVVGLAEMMTRKDVDEFLADYGDLEYYQLALHDDVQRKGQAFCNALDSKWRELIINMPEDPWNTTDDYSVFLAVAWLTAQEIANNK